MRKLDKFNKMIAMGAFCVGAAASLMGCGDNNQDTTEINNYSPEDEDPEEIYGPPEAFDGSDYVPVDEEPETIYGPPEMMDSQQSSEETTSTELGGNN